MHVELSKAIDEAFAQATRALGDRRNAEALMWLERAHILTQRRPWLHARSHWLMLRAGWQLGDMREVSGQIPRIVAALLFSRIWVPIGNTGRARVSAFQPMPISEELRRLLE
ncbi:DUF3703 domain-containing protein [Ectopseudomonas composti]|uniref:DUF3703 domain-containing protein n=1 Tax=Ectopseudomonas composti TaxID=658457 RepID=A0ABN0SCP1_9GAMM|nr:DUF3703 domain-containing protein [Pseudomonas composti]EZH81036.1 hypothetical protein AU05_11705 [Pseudomonas composti]MDN5516287.1 DUF3703 domain-containing protein [Pseudomonas sp.]